MKVEKIDGKIKKFDFLKIQKAVTKAFNSCDDKTEKFQREQEKFMTQLMDEFSKIQDKHDTDTEEGVITISEIEDVILKLLIQKKKTCVKDAYLKERDRKIRQRELKSRLVNGIREKLEASNIQNQNANVDEVSFGGRQGEATSFMTKQMALDYYVTEMSRNNHLNNEIYIHDLDSYVTGMHNCLSIPFDSLLEKGFNTRQTDVRGANSINTAFQLIAVIFQLQSLQQFGGVSATHIDWTMVPYVRKSFYKHYKDGLVYINKIPLDEVETFVSELIKPYGNIVDVPIFGQPYYYWPEAYEYAHQMTLKELRQAVEGMYHNLNTLQSRSGNQLPFSSINYGTCTLPEGKMVTKVLLEELIAGVGKFSKTSIFPCGIFQYMKGVNDKPGTPNYDLYLLALESTSKRLYPNYANVDWTINVDVIKKDREIKESVLLSLTNKERSKLLELCKENNEVKDFLKKLHILIEGDNFVIDNCPGPDEITSTMGCRTYNGGDINAGKDYFSGLIKKLINEEKVYDEKFYSFAQKDGRGNICPVTIILPTLAMESVESVGATIGDGTAVDNFMELLETKIDEAREMLMERFNWICKQSSESAKFMYENVTMAGYDGVNISSALRHGTLALGQLGLAETLQILIGCDHKVEKGLELAKRIEKLFNTKCAEFKEKYKLNFGVYYTPAENLCKTALRGFRNKYGIIENVSDKEFFTNSMHIPVWHDMTPFEKIDIESQLTSYSNAGCITYVELPSTVKHNVEAMETLVNYAMNHNIPYFAINVPNDQCVDCGYLDEIGETCPKCGSTNIKRLRRVTGYLSSDYRCFNDGKIDETNRRVKHIKG